MSRDVEDCGDVGERIAVSESLVAWTYIRRLGSSASCSTYPEGTGANRAAGFTSVVRDELAAGQSPREVFDRCGLRQSGTEVLARIFVAVWSGDAIGFVDGLSGFGFVVLDFGSGTFEGFVFLSLASEG